MNDAPSNQDATVQVREPTPRQKHAAAIDDLALSLPGLGKGLGPDCLPHTASEVDGLVRYGAPDGGWTPRFSLWLHWRNGMRAVATWDDFAGTRHATAVLPASVPDAMTDEAPGLMNETPAPADLGVEDQQRLGAR